jgi:serine/threonine protein phosphatase PrpC
LHANITGSVYYALCCLSLNHSLPHLLLIPTTPGFGLIAEPFVTVTELEDDCAFVVVASDGLANEEKRGGGGGLANEQVAALLLAEGAAGTSAKVLAQRLVDAAVEEGSTDDVSVAVLRLDTTKLPKRKAPAAAASEGEA